jgi:hypothetical protein
MLVNFSIFFLFSYLGFSPFPFFFCFLSFWFLWSSPSLLGFHSACQHHDWVFPVILLLLAFWRKLSTLVNAWSWPPPMASSWWSQWGCCQHMLLLKVAEHVLWVLILFKLPFSVGYVFWGDFLCSLGLVFHFSCFPISYQICNLYVGYLSIPFSFVTSIVSMEKFLVLMKAYRFSYMLLLLPSCHSSVIICLLQATMSEGCVTFKNLVPYWCVICLAVRQ